MNEAWFELGGVLYKIALGVCAFVFACYVWLDFAGYLSDEYSEIGVALSSTHKQTFETNRIRAIEGYQSCSEYKVTIVLNDGTELSFVDTNGSLPTDRGFFCASHHEIVLEGTEVQYASNVPVDDIGESQSLLVRLGHATRLIDSATAFLEREEQAARELNPVRNAALASSVPND